MRLLLASVLDLTKGARSEVDASMLEEIAAELSATATIIESERVSIGLPR